MGRNLIGDFSALAVAAMTAVTGLIVASSGSAESEFDTGWQVSDLHSDTGQPDPVDESNRIYNADGTYTLSTADRYQLGEQIELGPITWEYVGPAVFVDELVPQGRLIMDETVIPPARPSSHDLLLKSEMWDADGHLFKAVAVDLSKVNQVVQDYNATHPSDVEGPVASSYPAEPGFGPGDSWEYLRFAPGWLTSGLLAPGAQYDTWWHQYPQHDGVFITSRFRGDLASPSSSWYTKIQQPSQVVPEETDAVATDDYCSGVLIEPDVLLTARHCVLGLRDGREVRQDMTHQEWCTRGNLRGMNGACVNSQHAISIDPSDYAFGDTTLPWRDWALIRLQAPLISTDQTEATIMVLSQWEDLFDPVFEPELLAAPVLAGPLNQCQTVGGENNPIVEETDPVWDEKCDNFRYAKGDQGGSHGRALYHREDGDVFVDAVYRESIAFDLMFGSADSGGPVFWDGRSPGGTRFVTAVVSSAYYDSWGITHMRGPRIAEWRSEIISQCAALPEAD